MESLGFNICRKRRYALVLQVLSGEKGGTVKITSTSALGLFCSHSAQVARELGGGGKGVVLLHICSSIALLETRAKEAAVV